jgi:hypothetical protein
MPNVPAKKAFKAVNTDHSVLLSEGTLFCRASTPCGGRIDGKPKLRITGKALRKVLAGIPPESEIRLMVIGQRAIVPISIALLHRVKRRRAGGIRFHGSSPWAVDPSLLSQMRTDANRTAARKFSAVFSKRVAMRRKPDRRAHGRKR